METLHRSLRSHFISRIYQTHRGAKDRIRPHTLASLSFVGSQWGFSHTSDAPAGKPLPIKDNPQGGRGGGMREHAPCGTASLHIAVSQSSLCRNQNDPLRDRPLPSSFPPPALHLLWGPHGAWGWGRGESFLLRCPSSPYFHRGLGERVRKVQRTRCSSVLEKACLECPRCWFHPPYTLFLSVCYITLCLPKR